MIFAVWLFGAILALLCMHWIKDFEFTLPFDQDGLKVVYALIWPVVLILTFLAFVATLIEIIGDNVSEKIQNHKSDGKVGKAIAYLGKIYRKIF